MAARRLQGQVLRRSISNCGAVRSLHCLPSSSSCSSAASSCHHRRPRRDQPLTAPHSCSKQWFHASTPLLDKRDYYETLGVPKNASQAEIKKAYFQLAKKWHPDANKGNEEAEKKFAEISNAYDVLKDDKKREKYDMFGHDGEQMEDNPFGGMGGQGMGAMDAEEVLREFFGEGGGPFGTSGGGRRKRPQRGQDLQVTIPLAFLEAINGTSKTIRVQRRKSCEKCEGSGEQPGSQCKTCQGRGWRARRQGFFEVQESCSSCNGRGSSPCGTCAGQGVVGDTAEVKVTVPAGVDAETNLRLIGQGHAGLYKGSPGHLWIKFKIDPSPVFHRAGPDIFVTAPISFTTAALGGHVMVPTLAGEAKVKVPPGTQSGDKRAMRGKGVPVLNRPKSFGNQFVTFHVEVPTSLTNDQRALLEQYRALGDETPSPPHPTKPSEDKPGATTGDGDNTKESSGGNDGTGTFWSKMKGWTSGKE
eukprot:gb/GEZN01002680.1/.p1 GENE.gb/GEZN01002680.1/~~gb/GEZN01002680.1/.p1  ORF type:complete len:473 (+),score=70.48 gb/GEZN01002680.1/:899-2317(+)